MLGAVASVVTIAAVVVPGGRYFVRVLRKRLSQRRAEVHCWHEILRTPSEQKDWLVVRNTGPAVALAVTTELSDTPANRTVKLLGDTSPVAELGPGEQRRYDLVVLAESADEIGVRLGWTDRAGSHSSIRHINVA